MSALNICIENKVLFSWGWGLIDKSFDNQHNKTMLKQGTFFLGTIFFHLLGLVFVLPDLNISPFWPLAGWVFACFWVFGSEPFWVILLGNALTSYLALHSVCGSILFGLINSLVPLLFALILRRITDVTNLFSSLKDLFLFVLVGALFSASFNTGLGFFVNNFLKIVDVPPLPFIQAWFFAGVSGIIIFAPIFKKIFLFQRGVGILRIRMEFLLLLCTDFFVRVLLFTDEIISCLRAYPLSFLLMPIFFWAGLRLTFTELAIYVAFFSCTSIIGTISLHGPFAEYSALTSLLLVQLYVVTQVVMIYIIHTILTERKKEHRKLEQVQDVMIMTLASLADTRDQETGAHIARTKYYVKELSEELRRRNRFNETLTPSYIDDIVKSAPLHDIGKIGIPDSILLKPGKLTKAEFEIIKTHSKIGEHVLRNTVALLGEGSYLEHAVDIAATHHERWNGTGYPYGLKGDEIPLAGRIMAVADVYDALTMKRVYKASMPHKQAMEIMYSERGKHFDPIILDAFMAIGDRIYDVSRNMNLSDGMRLTEKVC